MKNQALFSSKDKSKKLKCRLLQLLFSALRAKFVTRLISISKSSVHTEHTYLTLKPECIITNVLEKGSFHLNWFDIPTPSINLCSIFKALPYKTSLLVCVKIMGPLPININYSQTCLKGSPKRRTKSGCLRQVTP